MKNVHFAIPEIYGESLSYYELLRKLVEKMNVVIENYDTIPDQIAEAVTNLDASQLFSTVLNQLIHSIATDNTKSAYTVKVYKKHDLLYATFNESVNLYESLIDFSTGTETELIVGSNIREVNISELFIELRKLIDINKNNIEAVKSVANKNSAEITTMKNDISDIENKNTEQDNEISTLRTMISSPYNFKGEVASISALPASGAVNDTYYVQDIKYKVTWTGSAWVQSSLSETDYEKELSELKRDLVNISNQDYFSLADKTNSKYVNENGVISDYEYFGVTDYIKIPPLMNSVTFLNRVTLSGEQYPLNHYEFALYDSNKSWLETIRGDTTVGYITRGIENENARYIRLNYGIHDIDDCVCIFNRIDSIKNKIKWYGFGDSITEGYGGNYFDIASKIINADYSNFGVGATGYLDNSGGSVAYQQLSNKDYSNVDLITLAWGINDYRSSKPLGDINDNHSSNTICGELNACIELLGLYAKESTVVIMTPLNISEVGTFESNYAYDTNNSANYSLNDLSDKLIAIANKYNLPHIDMRKEVGFTRYNLQNLLLSDGVHPNEKGVKKIGMLLGTKLNVRGF